MTTPLPKDVYKTNLVAAADKSLRNMAQSPAQYWRNREAKERNTSDAEIAVTGGAEKDKDGEPKLKKGQKYYPRNYYEFGQPTVNRKDIANAVTNNSFLWSKPVPNILAGVEEIMEDLKMKIAPFEMEPLRAKKVTPQFKKTIVEKYGEKTEWPRVLQEYDNYLDTNKLVLGKVPEDVMARLAKSNKTSGVTKKDEEGRVSTAVKLEKKKPKEVENKEGKMSDPAKKPKAKAEKEESDPVLGKCYVWCKHCHTDPKHIDTFQCAQIGKVRFFAMSYSECLAVGAIEQSEEESHENSVVVGCVLESHS